MGKVTKYRPSRRPTSGKWWIRPVMEVAGKVAGKMVDKYIGTMMETDTKGKEVFETTTDQKDYNNIKLKKRRRVSKKVKRRARRFRRRVMKVMSQAVTLSHTKTGWTQSFVLSADLDAIRGGSVAQGDIGRQSIVQLSALAYDGNQNQMNDDLNELLSILYASPAEKATAASVYIKSCLWEIMVKNVGTNSAYVDIYHWVAKKNSTLNVNEVVSNSDQQMREGGIPASSTNFVSTSAPEDYGWTPYQSPGIMSHYNIYRKTRYLIPAGSTIQLEKRWQVGRVWKKDQLGTDAPTVQNKINKGLTHGILAICYGTPRNDPNEEITGPHDLIFSYNKTFYFQEANTGNYVDQHWRSRL